MTIDQLTEKKLTRIFKNFFYIGYENSEKCGYNIFIGTESNGSEYIEFEPIDLKTMLIELSDKVQFGNNFCEVSNCLNLPREMRRDAELLDLELYNIFN